MMNKTQGRPDEQLLRTASERAQWRKEHNSANYLADVKFWREQVQVVVDDKGQSLNDIDLLSQLIERRGLSWDAFEADVTTVQYFAQPAIAAIVDEQTWQSEAERLGREEGELRQKLEALILEVNETRGKLQAAEWANSTHTTYGGQLRRTKAGNPRVFGDEASAFDGENCGIVDPTREAPYRLTFGGVG